MQAKETGKSGQKRNVLYMVPAATLLQYIDQLLLDGYRVMVVVRLREFTDPEMNGQPITDWLVISEEMENTR